MFTSYFGFWDYWNLYHKVTFDGENKTIIVNNEVEEISIKEIYSSWKEWAQIYDNAKYLSAIRTTGGDPIGGGVFTGDVYFLINGWKLSIDLQHTKVTGVLYSDDYPTAYYTKEMSAQYPAVVSSLVTTVSTSGGSGGATASEVWSFASRSLTTAFPAAAPTVAQIRDEMDNNSTKLSSIKSKVDTLVNGPTAAAIAAQVRTELDTELTHIMQVPTTSSGLSPTQATMILEIYELLGLDATKPLMVTQNSRTAGDISQTILTDANSTIITRN
jgi:hypothetical protein